MTNKIFFFKKNVFVEHFFSSKLFFLWTYLVLSQNTSDTYFLLLFARAPVLYSIKWGSASKPSRLASFGDCAHGCTVWITQRGTRTFHGAFPHEDVSLEIDMYGMTCRYDVNSTWLFRVIRVMLDPASNEPPGTNNKREEKEKEEEVEKEEEEVEEVEEVAVDVITELRLSLHDSVVDYVPTQPIPLHTAGRMVLVFR
jgi:hypothetical protein